MADFMTELSDSIVTDVQIPENGHQEIVDGLGLVSLDKVDHLKAQTRVERLFNFAQIFFLSLTFMSGWEAMALNLYSVFYNGGPQTLAWGILVVIAGACAQSASMAEMAAIQPIAGAQYHWTHLLAPQRYRKFITWMQADRPTGWITWFGWIAMLAGIANVTAVNLQGIIILNWPEYVAERWHGTLIIFAILIFSCLVNMYVFWIVPWFELFAGVLHIALFFVYSIILLVLSDKNDANFVFLSRVDPSQTSGWNNSFVNWNLGLLTPLWGFVGFDGAVHLSEEVRRAKKAVPRVMFWTIALNGVFAYAFILVILFTMGSVEDALASATGLPILAIFESVTGSRPVATAMGCGFLVISFSVNLACVASTSRLTWAWARDRALPDMFSIVSCEYRVPVNAIILCSIFVMILSLLNIATTVAFQAFIALTSIAIFASYLIAIGCMMYARYNGGLQLGEWNLGQYGMAVNVFAVIYTSYMLVFLPFPITLPVTGQNMNYALPIFAFVVFFAIGFWFIRGRKRWQGPVEDIINLAIQE